MKISSNTLLISDGSPDESVVDPNEILLRFLSTTFTPNTLVRVILSNMHPDDYTHGSWMGFRYFAIRKVRDRWWSTLPPMLRFMTIIPSLIAHIIMLFAIAPKQALYINKLLYHEGINNLIVVVSSPQVIYIVSILLRFRTSIKLHPIVWDSPEEFTLLLHTPWPFRSFVLACFRHLMRKSCSIGVASNNMMDEYGTRYAKHCFVLQGDVESNNDGLTLTTDINPITNSCTHYIIGFAGWLYTPRAWQALFDALDLCNWSLSDKGVIIRIIGNSISFSPSKPCHVEYYGKRSVSATRTLLSFSTVNFVPYRFSRISRYGCSMAFPSKINTYLSVGKPIFVVAPSYSTPYQYVNTHRIGLGCDTLNPIDIANSLRALIEDDTLYELCKANCDKLYFEKHSPNVFRRTFIDFMSKTKQD